MCLIAFALHARDDLPLVVAANRDEFYDRPTTPAAPWPEEPRIIAGRDLLAGGTWFGVTLEGRWAAVTNFREMRPTLPDTPSRGHLVADYLLGNVTPADYLAGLAPRAETYAGFNLLVGDRDGVRWFSNRGRDHPLLGVDLPPGIYGLSNHLLDTPWPKVVAARNDLTRAIEANAGADEVLEGLLDRTLAAEANLPDTGVPRDLELALSARFIISPRYGTRSSTVLRIDAGRNALLVERSYAPPDQISLERFDFQLRTA